MDKTYGLYFFVWFTLLVIVTARDIAASSKARKDDEANQELLRSLFRNYVKEAMPERPVQVKMDVLLIKFRSTLEKEGIFESVIGLFIEWRDRRLQWSAQEYANLTVLTFDASQVWLPDIAMTNSADHLYSISRDTRFVVRVSNDGHLKFVPTGTARTWCDFKMLDFPFDSQICNLEFESWALNNGSMTFDRKSRMLIDSQFSSNEWSLCDYSARTYDHTYEFTLETFTRVQFQFAVIRKSSFFIVNLIFPCATLSLIQLLVFLICHGTSADRISFATTNLLTLVVFQTIVTEEMPKTSDAVTALSKYIISLITLSTIGIVESVMVEHILASTKWGIISKPPSIKRFKSFILKCWILTKLNNSFKSTASSSSSSTSTSSSTSSSATNAVATASTKLERENRRSSEEFWVDSTFNGRTVLPFDRRKANIPKQSITIGARLDHEGRCQSFRSSIDSDRPVWVSFDPHNQNPSQDFNCLRNLPSEHAGYFYSSNLKARKTETNQTSFLSKSTLPTSTSSIKNNRRKLSIREEQKRKEQWAQLVRMIDWSSLVICSSLAIFIPLYLFGPLFIRSHLHECSYDAELWSQMP